MHHPLSLLSSFRPTILLTTDRLLQTHTLRLFFLSVSSAHLSSLGILLFVSKTGGPLSEAPPSLRRFVAPHTCGHFRSNKSRLSPVFCLLVHQAAPDSSILFLNFSPNSFKIRISSTIIASPPSCTIRIFLALPYDVRTDHECFLLMRSPPVTP